MTIKGKVLKYWNLELSVCNFSGNLTLIIISMLHLEFLATKHTTSSVQDKIEVLSFP